MNQEKRQDDIEKYTEEKVEEALNFLMNADHPSIDGLKAEFALDDVTAKKYFDMAIESRLKIGKKNINQKEEKSDVPSFKQVKIVEQSDDFENETSPEIAERLKEAFDTDGFLEFISANPKEDFSMKDTEEILKLFEVFKVKDKVNLKLKSLAIDEFKQQTGLEDEEVVESLDLYVERDSYLNPDMILEYAHAIDILRQNEESIRTLKSEIESKKMTLQDGKMLSKEECELELIKNPRLARFFGPAFERISNNFGKSLELINSENLLKKIGGGLKMVFWDLPYAVKTVLNFNSLEQKNERENARSKILTLTGMEKYDDETVDAYINTLKDQQNISESILDLEEEERKGNLFFASLKSQLATEILSLDEILKTAKDKIKQKIQDEIESEDVDFDTLKATQDDLESTIEKSSEKGIGYLDEGEIKELQEKINKKAKDIVSYNIVRSLTVNNAKGKDVFSSLTKTIKGTMEVGKVGTLESDDIRKTIKESLKKILDDKKTPPLMKVSIKAFIISNKI
ncbi:MAG: hypothetical protein PHN69_00185 [Candidatus Pacebacteria bacterium]|nr:hypothetical protein [Candidatus Paceibacterota bacterium]